MATLWQPYGNPKATLRQPPINLKQIQAESCKFFIKKLLKNLKLSVGLNPLQQTISKIVISGEKQFLFLEWLFHSL
jgi:hypothetical protein